MGRAGWLNEPEEASGKSIASVAGAETRGFAGRDSSGKGIIFQRDGQLFLEFATRRAILCGLYGR